MINKIFVLPTEDTIARLEDIFRDVNFQVNWDAIGVELGSSHSPLSTKADVVYQALPGGLNVWYDSATGTSNLIMPLLPSREMADRHKEIGDAWGRTFIPFIVLGPDPVLKRRRRGLLNSLATRLVDFPPLLEFHNETLVQDESVVPSQSDFHQDVLANGLVPTAMFAIDNDTE